MNDTPKLLKIDKIEWLKQIPLFQWIPEEYLVTISEFLHLLILEAETMVTEKDRMNTKLFMLIDGRCQIGLENEYGILQKGEYWGVFELLTPQPSQYTISCLEKCTILYLESDDFYRFLQDNEKPLQDVMFYLGETLRRLENEAGVSFEKKIL
ncbi:MAG: cyclic nucleotide-binding domain-containing protein [SAR324 cluster bacterium]|nr:cyclic nucleotide-binding domain-containing protein [SAR324 cluster bacterium]